MTRDKNEQQVNPFIYIKTDLQDVSFKKAKSHEVGCQHAKLGVYIYSCMKLHVTNSKVLKSETNLITNDCTNHVVWKICLICLKKGALMAFLLKWKHF